MRVPPPPRNVSLELYRPATGHREFELAGSAQCHTVAEAHAVIRANLTADLAVVTWKERRWGWLRLSGSTWRRVPAWSVQDVPYTARVRVTVTKREPMGDVVPGPDVGPEATVGSKPKPR